MLDVPALIVICLALLIAGFIAARRKAHFKLTFLKIFEVTLESGERDASPGPKKPPAEDDDAGSTP